MIYLENGIGDCFSWARFENMAAMKLFIAICVAVGDGTAYTDCGWRMRTTASDDERRLVDKHTEVTTAAELEKFVTDNGVDLNVARRYEQTGATSMRHCDAWFAFTEAKIWDDWGGGE